MKRDPNDKLRDAIVNFFTDEWWTVEDTRYHLPTACDFEFLLSAIEAARRNTIPEDLASPVDKLEDYLREHRPVTATLTNDAYDACHFAELADDVLQGRGSFCGAPFSARGFCEKQRHRASRSIDGIHVPADLNIVKYDS